MQLGVVKSSEVAVLVLSTRCERYNYFREAVHSSWLKMLSAEGVVCYLYAGDYSEQNIVAHSMELTAPDRLGETSVKLLAAIDFLLRTHPDIKLIYRTNLSSYIDPVNFLAYIKRHQLGPDSYCGVVGTTTLLREKLYGRWWLYNIVRLLGLGQPIQFASGSGFFIGINNAKKLLHGPTDLSLIDDVMVGKALGRFPKECHAPPRFDILDQGRHKISRNHYLHLVREDLLFHYRFKTSDRHEDARLLRAFSKPEFRMEICTGDARE